MLIATLATLLLTARRDRDRRTAAHDRAARVRRCASRRDVRRRPRLRVSAPPTAPYFEPIDDFEPEPNARDGRLEPAVSEPRAELAAGIDEIEQLADRLARPAAAARKVTVLGTASSESITLTALTLARLMARQAKIVVVDLAASSPTMTAVSVDPAAPGLAELMQGEASFAQIITKDRLSRVHLVSAGRPGFDRAQLQSPRLTLAIDALLRVYDHVLLDAGTASDLPAELLTAHARAVVVPDASMDRGRPQHRCAISSGRSASPR